MDTELLTFVPKDPKGYQLDVVGPNGKKMGSLYMEVDGFYVYDLPKMASGFVTEQFLMELAIKLSSLNAEWNEQIRKELAAIPTRPNPFLDTQISELGDLEDPFINTRTGEVT